MCVKYALFFSGLFSGGRGFFSCAFGCGASKAPIGTHYDARLDPGRAPWRCSEHSTSLSWLLLSRGCVPPPCSSRVGAWKTPYILPYIFFIARFPLAFLNFAPHPPHNFISTFFLPSLLSATTHQRQQQQQHSLVTATDGASVRMRERFRICVCMCVRWVCAVIGAQNYQGKR